MKANSITRRFWSKVDKTPGHGPQGDCWLWTGAPNSDGYGSLRIGSRRDGSRTGIKSHRLSYLLHYGNVPDGLQVLHRCDNPPCVNPDHLFLGTHTDNMRDRSAKGRGNHPTGERNAATRLSSRQVATIRERYAKGEVFQHQLAAEFGIAQTTVSAIVRGEIWK